MTKAMINSTLPKSKSQTIVEYILLAFCLCVLALRTTFPEAPGALSPSLPANLSDVVYSLSISGILIFSCIFYFLLVFCRKRFLYRGSGIEFELLLFCTASVIAGFAAADKRLAITNVVMLLAPVFIVILLVQILDSHPKIKLVLCVIGALGVVSACENIYQLLVTNQATIEQYEHAPQTFMEPLGIEPGTFQQFLFEHRLYTGGVRAFFTTRNSAGCFALMAAFVAFVLLIDRIKNYNGKPPVKLGANKNLNPYPLSGGAALIIILLGLIFTKSKGAIIGLLFAATLFIAYFYLGNWLKSHKKVILITCLLLAILCGWLVISYGLKHNRLPGGTGMLVRWQYWQASAKMYADHPLTGVGPGNFKHFYPQYKPAEALESVADPHNFLLSILTQYGPIGLIGFIAMILIPLWRVIFPGHTSSEPKEQEYETNFRTLAIIFLIVISAALLLIRPMILAETPADTLELKIFVISTIYIAPVLAFIAGFLLLSAPLVKILNLKSQITNIFSPILFCTVLGVLLNNLIDYAIFEPGVYTTFWVIIACMIVTDLQTNLKHKTVVTTKPFTKVAAVIFALIIIATYIGYAWLPVFRSTNKIQQAHKALSMGKYQKAHALFAEAGEYDKLDPTAVNLNGRLYLQQYNEAGRKQSILLKNAEECFQQAIIRNKVDFKNYEKLSEVYELLGQTQKAYDWCQKALQLYPGSDRLHFKLAQIAEKLGKTDIAIEQYKRTIEIEESFRRQFKTMYPERKEIVSRLGEEKYKFAIQRVKELSENNRI